MEDPAGVDYQRLTRRAIRAAERDDLVGYVVFVRPPFQGRVLFGPLFVRRVESGRYPGAVEESRSDAVDQNLWAERHGHAPGEVDEAGFRNCVGNGRASRAESGDGRDIDRCVRSLDVSLARLRLS